MIMPNDHTKLEMQAARIESVLNAYKVSARVWGAKISQRYVRFDLTTALGTRLNRVNNLSEELALSLGVKATRVYRDGGLVHIEIPNECGMRTSYAAAVQGLTALPAFCGLLGLDEGNMPLVLKISSPDIAHVLIAGTTGSGKTVLMRSLLLSLIQHNPAGKLQLALIDPKERGLAPLNPAPHRWRGHGVARSNEQAGALLSALVTEMERRDREKRDLPRIVVAIDELADLLQVGGKPVAELLQRLTQRGREAGIHVVAATQRPAAALLGGTVIANFPTRLVGSVASADDAKVAAGINGSGAERLLGRGDFLLINKGTIVRFQVPFLDATECSRSAAALWQPKTARPSRQPALLPAGNLL